MNTEARASWNIKLENGEMWTLRAGDGETDADFVERVKAFKAKLNGALQSKPAAQPQPDAPMPAGAKQIPVVSISLAAGGDHPRWVIKGGNLTKFGVTCWPETLEAAGILRKLNPVADNKPQGNWIALYNERQNDAGKWVPDKVTEIRKA